MTIEEKLQQEIAAAKLFLDTMIYAPDELIYPVLNLSKQLIKEIEEFKNREAKNKERVNISKSNG